jgi:hypothetical protein
MVVARLPANSGPASDGHHTRLFASPYSRNAKVTVEVAFSHTSAFMEVSLALPDFAKVDSI